MTLVEVLVATVLMGIGVVGLISAATQGMRRFDREEQRAVALGLIQEKLAEIEMIGPQVWMLARPESGTEQRGNAAYTWTTQIDEQQAGALFSVNITVSWAGPAGNGSVEIETWLNDYKARSASSAGERESGNPSEAARGGTKGQR